MSIKSANVHRYSSLIAPDIGYPESTALQSHASVQPTEISMKIQFVTQLDTAPTIRPLSAAAEIRALAAKHGVKPFRSQLDDWADAVTRLAGDDVELDEIHELLIALSRAGVIDGETQMKLFGRYAKEQRAA